MKMNLDTNPFILFIEILIKLFNSQIKFDRCKDLPLIPYASFNTDNAFRINICKILVNFKLIKSWKDLSKLHPNNSRDLYGTVIQYMNREWDTYVIVVNS